MPLRTDETVQVIRHADGLFGYQRDRAELPKGAMLIGRGLDKVEALDLIEEFNAAAAAIAGGQR